MELLIIAGLFCFGFTLFAACCFAAGASQDQYLDELKDEADLRKGKHNLLNDK